MKASNEANNCAASASTVLVGWADLVVTSISNPLATASPGSKFTLSDTVLNQGTIPAGASATRYYLSFDAVRNGADTRMTGNRSVLGLASGESSAGNRRVTVPLTTPTGTYFVLACADDQSKVPESDNTNNCRASGAAVTITP